ncbi:rhodanese-like domain-containing protein [Lentzea flaviverrucosa]|uniref:Rhodanese-related sulfurtransferase n=1 Tax=Lentzea flaviverrucosa TaxID=200379 RepID=A0A1H9XXP0_9PSEU|nr:rhodanese-like domain-containing protein [Lentzea flaviverrucosa]RDI34312.1 rhodanese-related sulfurtransferase [Lentzea flaviverrucosa]SES50517.1 Rhodanese-related sulfurtransferase [Lentzea flaviverrucosa]
MSTPTKLDVAQLRRQVASGACPRLIDVRTPGEFETVHIPGSYNVPLDLLREHRDELRAHLDEQVVLICRTGRRAVEAEQALAAAGLPNLRLLDGGMVAWQAAGGEVRHGAPRWDLERQVRLVAGAIVLTAVLVGVLVPPVTWLAGLVGAGLVVASLTNTCLMGMLLAKLPCNRGPRTTFTAVVAALSDGSG